MAINIDLHQNFDGSLNGRYKLGNKPSLSWQLPTANYVAAKMPLALTFPRPEAAATCYSKNAHPNVEWSVPICVQGGAAPFYYEITDNGGVGSLVLQSFMDEQTDPFTGRTTYQYSNDWGVLKWSNPLTGSYSFTVRVTDQAGATLDVAISLTVGTSGWVFIDTAGNDSTGDGSFANPYASVAALFSNSHINERVYFRGGTHTIDNPNEVAKSFHITQNSLPHQYIGYPNETVRAEVTDRALFVADAQDDYLFKDFELAFADNFRPDDGNYFHLISLYNGGDRFSILGMTFTDFIGVPYNVSFGNTALLFCQDDENNYVTVKNVKLYGTVGPLVSAYLWKTWLVEGMDFTSGTPSTTDNASSQAFMYIKVGDQFGSIRFNDLRPTSFANSAIAINGGSRYGSDMHDIEICYNKIRLVVPDDPYNVEYRSSALKFGTYANYSEPSYNFWAYRNSIENTIRDEANAQNMPTGTIVVDGNFIQGGGFVQKYANDHFALSNNSTDQVFFDSEMNLLDSFKTAYLGTRGAEIAGGS